MELTIYGNAVHINKKRKTKKVKEKNDEVIVIPSSPLILIKKNFEKVTVNKTSTEDEEILRSTWDGTFWVNETEINFSIKQYSKHKLSYLSITAKKKM